MQSNRMISSAFRGILTRFGYRPREPMTRMTRSGSLLHRLLNRASIQSFNWPFARATISMAEDRAQRRLAAIMVADVVGYSRLMEADEAGTLSVLKQRRKAILEPVVRARGGRIVKVMGDGALIEFASAVNAVTSAVELQHKIDEANEGLSTERRIVLRIGINLGDVIGEGSDIYGEGVNIAARLEPLADPGGICISAKVHEEVRGKIEASFDDLGERSLKNIERQVRVYRVRLGDSVTSTGPALALPNKPSIAVLPFENLSDDPEQEYFADGMVEEIITALSRTRWLFVIARNSSFAYKGRNVDVKQVGRELGVRYVLEGSVRKAANRVRITGQLIDARSGVHIWAERFDGALEDIFDLQDQVTANVVGAIAPKLEQAEIDRIKMKPTESLQAYDCYLRGLAGLHQWSRAGNDEALKHLYRAIELDPGFAAAYGIAARVYVQRNSGGWIDDPDGEFAEAERLARRAVDLGPDDAIALSGAGFALADMCEDPRGGAACVDKALALNPSLASAWLYSAWIRASMGEAPVALEHIARARRLSPHDPQSFSTHAAESLAYFIAGQYTEAFACAEASLQVKPDYLLALCLAAASAAHSGMQTEAGKMIPRALRLNPRLRISNILKIQPFHRRGDAAEWINGLHKAGLPE
jgi:TolB-like protein